MRFQVQHLLDVRTNGGSSTRSSTLRSGTVEGASGERRRGLRVAMLLPVTGRAGTVSCSDAPLRWRRILGVVRALPA
jgi:hypothetical protein